MADKRPAKRHQSNKPATDDKQTMGKRTPLVKSTPARIAFARRLHAGWVWCGMSWPEIGARLRTRRSPDGMSGESVGRLAREDAEIQKPPTWEVQEALERIMGLPPGYLNGEGELPPTRRRAHRPTEALRDANGTRARIEDQLAVFERQGATVEPGQVRQWLLELIRAMARSEGPATAPAAGGGLTEAEWKHLEDWRKDQGNQPPGRKRKDSNGE